MNTHQPLSLSLGRQVDLTNLVTAGSALLVASLIMMAYQFFSLRASLVEDVRVQARIIGDNSAAAIIFDDRRASEETLQALAASPSVEAASVFSAAGKQVATYRRGAAGPMQQPSEALRNERHEFSLMHLQVLENIDLDLDRRRVGYVVIRVSLQQLYGRLAGYALLMLVVALGSLAVAYFLVARMRHAVKSAEAHLDYLAHVDSVTSLPNRHTFNHRLAFAINKVEQFGGALGLLLLDLDNFKIVNDTLGHHAGDKLLKQVAQRLVDALRGADTVCRIGGDEFAVIVESKGDALESEWVGEKLLHALAAPFQLDKHDIYVTGSVGLSLYPRDALDLETLTRNADTAMYQAKAKGKNCLAKFVPEMDQRAQQRMSLESKLRKAIERDELVLFYQPMLDVDSNRILCVEALLRWNHPELGLVSPNDFIPVAEESGLIVPIGRWVLRTACRQVAAWRDAGLGDVAVAVNLSARQTKDTGLVDEILSALHESSLPPSLLELEITESVLMDNVRANEDLLLRLQTESIRLAIDDFGTGYSSMAYLKRFPIDQLKIDRTFVRDIPGDGDDEAITTAIIAMAHSLGLTVVAEGVETAEQLAFLRAAQCDTIQGFFFARPMPADQVTLFMRETIAA